MKKRIISIALILVVLVFGGLLAGKALIGKQVNVSWYNEDETEFIIETADQLYELVELSEKKDLTGKTFKLGADIVVNEGNASDWAENAPNRKWYPIKNFSGTFDGQGHTISGLYANIYDKAMGLFVETQKGAVVRDFRLVNTYFKIVGSPGSAAIAGGVKNIGTFEKIYTDAIIDCDGNLTGGIASSINGESTISECWFDGSIIRYYYNHTGGGIVAQVNTTTLKMEHCLNSGSIVADKAKDWIRIGGLCGLIAGGGKLHVTDSLVTGTIDSITTKQVGSTVGFVGSSSTGSFDTVFATTETHGVSVGNGEERIQGGAIRLDAQNMTGYNGYSWTNLDFDKYWAVDMDGTPILKHFAEEEVSLEGVAKNYNTDWYTGKSTEYTISTREELYGFSLLAASKDFTGVTVKLGSDITINEGDAKKWAKEPPANFWIPIMNWTGIFDGQGHTISGLYMDGKGTMGLFYKTMMDSVVKNFRLTNSYFNNSSTSTAYTGSIAGIGGGEFNTIYSDAIMTSTGVGVGGVVGSASVGMPKIINCWFDGNITLKGEQAHTAAGMAASVTISTSIEHCLNTADISANRTEAYNRLGGMAGVIGTSSTLTIKDSLNTGKITAGEVVKGKTAQAGSIIGFIGSSSGAVLDTVCMTLDSFNVAVGQNEDRCAGMPIQYEREDLLGIKGYQWTNLDFTNYWAAVKDKTPELKSFAGAQVSTKGVARKFDISWYKADKKSFTISDAADLYGVAMLTSAGENFKGKTIKIEKDITVNAGDASTWATNAPEDSWIPIANFLGTFDGQGHTINGLYKNGGTNIALFANAKEETVIKNVAVENSYFANKTSTGNVYIAGIVAQGGGTIDTVYSNVIIETTGVGAGGILACANVKGAKVKNAWFAGEIHLLGDNAHSGAGIIAIVQQDTSLETCLFAGKITAERTTAYTRCGGFFGVVGNKSTSKIKDSLSVGEIKSAKQQAGAAIGFLAANVNLDDDVYVANETYSTQIGQNRGELKGSLNKVGIGNLKGEKAKENASKLDFEKYWMTLSKRTPILKSFESKAPELVELGLTPDTSWYNKTDKTFTLTTVEQLYGLVELSYDTEFEGIKIQLGADITVNEGKASEWKNTAPQYAWDPIQTFAGTFDGQGHTISGLYIDNGVNAGLFAQTTEKSIVKNFKLVNSYFTNNDSTGVVNIGGIAGQGGGRFDTIYTDVIIATKGQVIGGIIACVNTVSDNNIINNCWFAGELFLEGKDAHTAGGIVGEAGIATSGTPGTPGTVRIENCLVDAGLGTDGKRKVQITTTGRDYNAKGDEVHLRIGGLCGIVSKAGSKVTSAYNMVLGSIVAPHSNQTGSLMGYRTETDRFNITCCKAATRDTYVLQSSWERVLGNPKLMAVKDTSILKETDLYGYDAIETASKLDFTATGYWFAVEGATPVLRSFSEGLAEALPPQVPEEPETPPVTPEEPENWYDPEGTSFTITTIDQLCDLAELSEQYNFAGQTFYLGKDLDLNFLPEGQTAVYWKESANAPSKIWTPIGTAEKPFAGTFDGKGHTISGLYYSSTTATNIGLFGYTSTTAVIRDLRLENSYFKGAQYVGSISSQGGGTFDTIYTNAYLETTDSFSGGIIAMMDQEITDTTKEANVVNNCWFAGTIDNTKTTKDVELGGIVGRVKNKAIVTVQNCLVNGVIKATNTKDRSRVGGICGCVSTAGSKLILKDNLIMADMQLTKILQEGSMVGFVAASGVNVEYSGHVYVLKLGEFNSVGQNKGTITGATTYLHEITDVTQIQGKEAFTNAKELFRANYWAAVKNNTPVLRSFLGKKEEVYDDTWYNETDETFTLTTISQFMSLSELSKEYNFAGQTIYLGADMEINELPEGQTAVYWKESANAPSKIWTPIGTAEKPFAGTFDGKKHTISGLYYSSTTATNIGMFGYTSTTAVIKDFRLEDSYFKGVQYVGSISSQGGGTFDTIYTNAYLETTDSFSGGIIAMMDQEITDTTKEANVVNNCWFAGTIDNTKTTKDVELGGIVGRVKNKAVVTVQNCLINGIIKTTNTKDRSRVGGICGCVSTAGSKLILKDNLIMADMQLKKILQEGTVVGFVAASGVDVEYSGHVYVLKTGEFNPVGQNKGSVKGASDYVHNETDISDLYGNNLTLDNTFWQQFDDKTPVLKSFYEEPQTEQTTLMRFFSNAVAVVANLFD